MLWFDISVPMILPCYARVYRPGHLDQQPLTGLHLGGVDGMALRALGTDIRLGSKADYVRTVGRFRSTPLRSQKVRLEGSCTSVTIVAARGCPLRQGLDACAVSCKGPHPPKSGAISPWPHPLLGCRVLSVAGSCSQLHTDRARPDPLNLMRTASSQPSPSADTKSPDLPSSRVSIVSSASLSVP